MICCRKVLPWQTRPLLPNRVHVMTCNGLHAPVGRSGCGGDWSRVQLLIYICISILKKCTLQNHIQFTIILITSRSHIKTHDTIHMWNSYHISMMLFSASICVTFILIYYNKAWGAGGDKQTWARHHLLFSKASNEIPSLTSLSWCVPCCRSGER